MRASIVIGLATCLLANYAAEAQTAAANSATGTAAANAAAPAATAVPDPATASGANTNAIVSGTPVVVGSGTGTSTASLPQVQKTESQRRFKAEIYNYNEVAVRDANTGHGSLKAASNYLGLRYVLDATQSVSLRQQFSFNFPKSNEDLKMKTGDLYINYTKADLFKFLNDGSATLLLRAYLPTGEKSRNVTKTNGSLNNWFVLSKPLGSRVTFEHYLISTYYLQSQNGYMAAQADGTFKMQPNTNYAVTQFFNVDVALAKNLTFSQAFGTESAWYRPVSGIGTKREHSAMFDSSLAFSGIPNLSLTLGITQASNIYDPEPNTKFRLYKEADTAYYFKLASTI